MTGADTPKAGSNWLPPMLRPTGADRWSRTRTERTRKDWVIDALVILVVLAGAVATRVEALRTPEQLPADWLVTLDLVLLPISAVVLLWRRRWPLQIAVLLTVFSIASVSSGVACVFAVFALGRYCNPRDAILGMVVLLLPLPIVLTLWPSTDGTATAAFFTVVVTLGVGAWGMFTGTRHELMEALRDRADRAEREQELQVSQARQQERSRIAREMHDVLAHRMALLSLHAGALEYRPDATPEAVARAAGVIRSTAHEALEELRAVIGVLRVEDVLLPDETDGAPADGDSDGRREVTLVPPEAPQPTLADVPQLIREWQQAGARVAVRMDLGQVTEQEVPVTLGRTAYRIIQEGLTNAGKHAAGARVVVTIEGEPGVALRVTVINPRPVETAGRPTQSAIPGTGVGLIGLRERAEIVGGELRCGERADGSFELHACLPWTVASSEAAA